MKQDQITFEHNLKEDCRNVLISVTAGAFMHMSVSHSDEDSKALQCKRTLIEQGRTLDGGLKTGAHF